MLLAASAQGFTIPKSAGALYLIVLGFRAIRRASGEGTMASRPPASPRAAVATTIAVGTFLPKTILFLVAFVTQFVSPDRDYAKQARRVPRGRAAAARRPPLDPTGGRRRRDRGGASLTLAARGRARDKAGMRIRFVKCHGSGNDFPLVDARALSLAEDDWVALARALADRTGPVGGDGILALTAGDADSAFGMRMFNSDGSEAETCLNGLRCVARAGFEALELDHATVRLKASHATVALAPPIAPGVHTVAETAGPATLALADWPLHIGADRLVDRAIPALDAARRFTAVAIPNPHLIAFVDAVDEGELVRIGLACEAAPDWLPHRANVSFVQVLAPDALFVRTHERGVGLTDSCGSAMAASTYAACLTGRIAFDTDVTVRNRGGRVKARAGSDAMVTLHGNATWEWEGEVDVDLSQARAGGLTVLRHHGAEVAAWSRAVEE